jgi:hypothetical protein
LMYINGHEVKIRGNLAFNGIASTPAANFSQSASALAGSAMSAAQSAASASGSSLSARN